MSPVKQVVATILLMTPICWATAQEAPATAADEGARERLLRSASYVASLPEFSVNMAMNFELSRKTGEPENLSLTGQLGFGKDDRVRFRIETPDGPLELYISPESSFLFLGKQNQFMEGSTFGKRQKAITSVLSGPFRPAQFLLSDFLHNDPRLLETAGDVTFVTPESADPAVPDHLGIKDSGISTEFWIGKGDAPILQKFTMDMSEMAAGSDPRITRAILTYSFTDWNVKPAFESTHFTFAPPEGATEFRPERPKDPMVGQVAPAISLGLLGEGKLDLAAHKGKDIVILDFWASWCGPCRIGLPIVTEVAGQFKDKNVVLYAVNVGEDRQLAENFVKEMGMTATVALDPDKDATRKYQADRIPKTVIVDKAGIIHSVHQGVAPGMKSELTEVLTALAK